MSSSASIPTPPVSKPAARPNWMAGLPPAVEAPTRGHEGHSLADDFKAVPGMVWMGARLMSQLLGGNAAGGIGLPGKVVGFPLGAAAGLWTGVENVVRHLKEDSGRP